MADRQSKYATMADYYREQPVLPTHASFNSHLALESYASHRRRSFVEKLRLPPQVFHNARLIEFGPDSGENSLVFARWGANCTLVEPNANAHPVIRSYFDRFELSHRLTDLLCLDVKAFADQARPLPRYDVLDAEGFIYTVKPDELWIDLVSELIEPGGFVILTYYETFSAFPELMLKVIHSATKRLTGMSALDVAKHLFSVKWASIPHTRAMESWVMDVLENPFVRLPYFLEALSLCRRMRAAGFELYSSWPSYKDPLNVEWFRKVITPDEQLALDARFIAHSRLSHVFGRKHFLLRADRSLETQLERMLSLTDGLIDSFATQEMRGCIEQLSALSALVDSDLVFSDEEDRLATLGMIRSFQEILGHLAVADASAVVRQCNTDARFIHSWGVPSHYAVFRKSDEAPVRR